MENMSVAIQVYSVRQEAEADFKGTMHQLKEMGYDGVELAGMYGLKAEEIREILDQNELTAISAHVSIEAFIEDMEGTIRDYERIGCSYIGIPMLTSQRLYGGEAYQETLTLIREISENLAKKRITLLYHNHDFEFMKTDKGSYILDELFDAFDPAALATELDTCWVKVAGEDPAAYIKKYCGRCPVVHVKDFKKEEEVELLALGEGEQDVKAIAQAAGVCGTKWLVIEQDDHPYGSPMENMAKSVSYLKNILTQYEREGK